jgi:hypothetical protein
MSNKCSRSRLDLDALTIRRDPPKGELRGTIRIHTSDPAFPEFVAPVSASIRRSSPPLRIVQAINCDRSSANYLLGSLSCQSDFSHADRKRIYRLL